MVDQPEVKRLLIAVLMWQQGNHADTPTKWRWQDAPKGQEAAKSESIQSCCWERWMMFEGLMLR